MQKAVRVFLIIAIGVALTSELNIAAQSQPSRDSEFAVLLSGAALGATGGALSTDFFKFSLTWVRYCGKKITAEEFINQRYRQDLLAMTLGPTIGAIIGIVAVSQVYRLEGNLAMASVGGFVGVGAGLGVSCYLARVTKGQPATLEFVSMILPIGFAILGAVNSYDARRQSNPRASHQPTSSAPTMSFTLWSLRF